MHKFILDQELRTEDFPAGFSNFQELLMKASSNTGSGGVGIMQAEQYSNRNIELTLPTLEKMIFHK